MPAKLILRRDFHDKNQFHLYEYLGNLREPTTYHLVTVHYDNLPVVFGAAGKEIVDLIQSDRFDAGMDYEINTEGCYLVTDDRRRLGRCVPSPALV